MLAQIEANGPMRMAGFFPSVPSQVNFEMLSAPMDGRWRIFGIAVNVGAGPVAGTTTPAPQPTQAGGSKLEAAKPAPKPAP